MRRRAYLGRQFFAPVGAARAGVVGAQTGAAIPDSAINQYLSDDFTASQWPDSIGSLDLDSITGLSLDETAFGGRGGVSGDGVDDNAQDGQFAFVENNYYNNWAISFGFSTSGDGGVFGVYNPSNTDDWLRIDIGGPVITSGELGASRRANKNTDQRVGSVAVDDGGEYVAIIQSSGSAAGDIGIYFSPTTDSSDVEVAGDDPGTGTTASLTDATYFAINSDTGLDDYFGGDLTDIRWYNTAPDASTREEIFNLYDWYDPSTDSPA